MTTCPHCGHDTGLPAAIDRVRYMQESWGNSPAPYLSGSLSDLETLRDAGLAIVDRTGWWIPTSAYPAPIK